MINPDIVERVKQGYTAEQINSEFQPVIFSWTERDIAILKNCIGRSRR